MHQSLINLKNKYHLDIQAPFSIVLDTKTYSFQYLIKGYGAKQGMVIDKDWTKLSLVADKLSDMGFGFSCFDIEDSNIDDFQEVLDDWGKNIS